MTTSNNIRIMTVRNVAVMYTQRLSFFRHRFIKALTDISFDIFKGETLGVIGHNGSGKSTLLRLLAGIYSPDSGHIESCAEKVSLQTVAAGFDADLTGRDNILVSSMLLGFSKKQAMSQMDNIIEFSELGSLVERPVKTYSTGMRARLGFSVAIKMKTDLLLIDEVLSVGDINFRKKAEDVMAAKMASGQTVVLVSHAIGQVERVCDRVICLHEGRLLAEGMPEEIIEIYQNIR